MRIQKSQFETRYILEPGEFYFTDKEVIISTLLGSCVSACLFDPIHRVIGMNHFLLSSKRFPSKESLIYTDAGRYGTHAMELVINGMLKLGANKKNIKAKAFGGGNVLTPSNSQDDFFQIGDLNIKFIKDFLEREKIPLISSDLGGNHGRVIHFHSNNYAVFVRKIGSKSSTEIVKRDKEYWIKFLKEHDKETPDIELWQKNSFKKNLN